MAVSTEALHPVDRLQNEVNGLLEQIAHIFATYSAKDSPTKATSKTAKLKHNLPGSLDRFHDALDQLENELSLAKLVIRRDLAICRSQCADDNIDPAPPTTTPQNDNIREEKLSQPGHQHDVTMTDANPDHATTQQNENLHVNREPSEPEKSSRVPDVNDAMHPPGAEQIAADNSKLRITTRVDHIENVSPVASEQHPSAADQTAEQDDTKQPETAISNTADLESLFGPTSAIIDPSDDNLPTGADDNSKFDFNFDDPEPSGNVNQSTNENIDSFLPGLHDYANSELRDSGDTVGADLDALLSDFATVTHDHTGGVEGQNLESVPNTGFDDLLNFEDLDAGEFSATGDGNQDDNGDFQFDLT